MRTTEEYDKILTLHHQGYNCSQISRKINIPRTTIRDYITNINQPNIMRMRKISNNNILEKIINQNDLELRKEYSYLLGIFLGDGCLSKMNKGVYRIRITLDAKYPGIINKVKTCVSTVMPNNKTSLVKRYVEEYLSCVDVSCYSKDWVNLFPFYQPGYKWKYKIQLTDWQKSVVENYPKEFWLGLFHSDGSRYKQTNANKYYYQFAQKSEDITNLFMWCSNLLGIKYGITKNKTTNRIQIYNKDSIIFLDTFAGSKL